MINENENSRLRRVKKEKYKTNHTNNDARYIFDWDDYIEEKKDRVIKRIDYIPDSKFRISIQQL